MPIMVSMIMVSMIMVSMIMVSMMVSMMIIENESKLHEIVKIPNSIRRLLPTNCLREFDHFVEFRGLTC